MNRNFVAKAQNALKGFKNEKVLSDIFTEVAAIKGTRIKDPLEKMHRGVLLATDDINETVTFAHNYAMVLSKAGIIQQNTAVWVDWENLKTASNSSVYQTIKEVFATAAGSLLVVNNAYARNTRLEDKLKNYALSAALFEQIDKAGSGYTFQEAPDKPVVIMTGNVTNLRQAYAEEPQPFDMRFTRRVGL